MIKVTIKNNKEYLLDKPTAFVSKTIKNFIEDLNIEEFTYDKIDEKEFAIVHKFMELHKNDEEPPEYKERIPDFSRGYVKDITRRYEDQNDYDKELIKDLEISELLSIMEKIDFLGIRKMMDLCSMRIAFFMRDKTTEELRILFDMKNDFTQEEEEAAINDIQKSCELY